MPIYEFYCKACDENFDILLDEPEKEVDCPKCGCMSKRQFSSPPSFQLKGQGWPGKEIFQNKPDTILDGKKKVRELYMGKAEDDHGKPKKK